MPDTHGFDVVAEVDQAALLGMLRAAWDNGGTTDPGAIPHEVPIPPGTALGPYAVKDGQVSIPREGLSLAMAPAQNGVSIGMATTVEVQMDPATTHLDSLGLFSMEATISFTAPVGKIPDSEPNIGLILLGLPRSAVSVALTSGSPIPPITLDLVKEYVHDLYTDGAIPHTQEKPDQSYPPMGITFDAYFEIWDDLEVPERTIQVTQPDATHIRLELPIYVRLSDMAGYPNIQYVSPMAVVAKIVLDVPYTEMLDAGKIIANLSAATVGAEDIQPADGIMGAHYTTALAYMTALPALFEAQIEERGQALVSSMDDMEISVPTVAQIEELIGDHVHAALLERRYAAVWTPTTPEGSPVAINEARPKALSTALAIAINPETGADENQLGNFIPAGKAFAVGLEGQYVWDLINDIVQRSKDDGGFGGVPQTFDDIEGYKCRLNSMSWELQDGKIHFSGSVTVYDVFCGADADCDFWADIGMKWSAPDANGAQTLVPYLIDSDASLPWWAWLLVVLGFIFNLIIGIIMLVITCIIDDIADEIGAGVMTDEVNGQLQQIGAWPQNLQGIGKVTSTFDETVIIEPSGLIFYGSMLVTAKYAMTKVSFADANGPYSGFAGSPLSLSAGAPHTYLGYAWNLGDGAASTQREPIHTYKENGLYVARLGTLVNQPGGALTHKFARVHVHNVAPVVEAGPDITVKEGQTFTVTGFFKDKEWVDKHEAIWDFGDDTLPVKGAVIETNKMPASKGTVTASHAYCNNGVYTVRLRVWDDDGSMGEDTLTVRVENVAPKVETDGLLFAYPCVPVTLLARFVDPGWCDTHRSFWYFGDGDFGLEPTPATVREVHEPPMGYGISAVTHTYRALATHVAHCIVLDSDNAFGLTTLNVAVVDLMNKTFEAGFHVLPEGLVANEWEPFHLRAGKPNENGVTPKSQTLVQARFDAEQYVVRDGQRSQRIEVSRGGRAGILQRVGANMGWDYQVTAHFHVPGGTKGRALVGLDPKGGADPAAPSVVWTEADLAGGWHHLLVRVTAGARLVTVFLAAEHIDGDSCVVYFDAVAFEPFPCRLPPPKKPALEPVEHDTCVGFDDEMRARELPDPYIETGFTFEPRGKRALRIVLWGTPERTGKLWFPAEGMRVTLPFVAEGVRARVESHTEGPVVLRALDAHGKVLGEAFTETPHAKPQTLAVRAKEIVIVEILSHGRDGMLTELCATQKTLAETNGASAGHIQGAQFDLAHAAFSRLNLVKRQ